MLAKGDEREMNFMLSLVKGLEPAIRPEGSSLRQQRLPGRGENLIGDRVAVRRARRWFSGTAQKLSSRPWRTKIF
jgi:hypothetical protein